MEVCRICTKKYETVYRLPNKLWKRVIENTAIKNGNVCPKCIDDIARMKKIYLYWEANENRYPTNW